MTLGTGGLVAPVGDLIMAHGMDHFFTGLQTAFSGNPIDNVSLSSCYKNWKACSNSFTSFVKIYKGSETVGRYSALSVR